MHFDHRNSITTSLFYSTALFAVLDRRSLEQLKLDFILWKCENFCTDMHNSYWYIDICCTDLPPADQQNAHINKSLFQIQPSNVSVHCWGFDLISSRCFNLYLSGFLRHKTEDTTGPHMHDEKQMHSFTTLSNFTIDFKDIKLDWQACSDPRRTPRHANSGPMRRLTCELYWYSFPENSGFSMAFNPLWDIVIYKWWKLHLKCNNNNNVM